MMTLDLPGFITTFLAVMAALFVFAVGVGILLVAVLYVIDITQTQHAIRRNFPVIGRLRYRMEHLGVFFRQYFYAMDREEMPFNRAQRAWVYRAAKNLDTTQPFGSTRDLRAARHDPVRQRHVSGARRRASRPGPSGRCWISSLLRPE